MKKQIMEIKDCIDNAYGVDCAYFGVDGFAIASSLYKAGYHLQDLTRFCPNCGAHMKGGAE